MYIQTHIIYTKHYIIHNIKLTCIQPYARFSNALFGSLFHNTEPYYIFYTMNKRLSESKKKLQPQHTFLFLISVRIS